MAVTVRVQVYVKAVYWVCKIPAVFWIVMSLLSSTSLRFVCIVTVHFK